jgi:hypothetical protein
MRGMFGMAALVFASVLTSGACGAADGPPPWAYGTPGAAPMVNPSSGNPAAGRGGAQAASDDGALPAGYEKLAI